MIYIIYYIYNIYNVITMGYAMYGDDYSKEV